MRIQAVLHERVRTKGNCGPDIRNRSGVIVGIETPDIVHVRFDGYERADLVPISILWPVDAISELGNIVRD